MRSDAIKVLIHYSSMQVYKNHVHQTPDVLDKCKSLYTQKWTPHFKSFMKMVQKSFKHPIHFPIGTYNFHDDTAVVRNLQDVTNSSAHHNPRRTRIVKTI